MTERIDTARVEEFRPRHQARARALVLEGLGEHWGFIDASVNPDLDDIAAAFASGYFACAWLAGDRGESQLVGTGGFVATGDGRVEIRRMSVASGVRRQGIGATVLHHLIEIARARGVHRVVLETTDTWAEAMAFYERNGFQCFEERDGDAWFELALDLDADRGRGARGA